ncbi:FAD-dependent oxidoreductase [Kineococcus sp. T90]|nr:FAD-dependent oxidoreductase [Kineococcus indalonis]
MDAPAQALAAPPQIADRYDVVVVGSGAGGGIAAWQLARAGRRVLLVERGGWPATAELAHDHLRNPRSASGLDPLTGPRGTTDPRTLLTGSGSTVLRPGDSAWNANAMLLGGGTRVYGAQAWRFCPEDFRMASRYGVPEGSALADWPIDYQDLEPYYDEVEWALGVSAEAGGDPWAGPRSRGFPMPALGGGEQERLLAEGARRLGLGTTTVPLLVNATPRAGRAACVRCAQCVGFACPVDAKSGTHNTALPWALATGRCTVLPGTRVERVLAAGRERVQGVALVGRWRGRTWRRVVHAEEVVLAAGAVETARLLLASAHEADPAGMGNSTDQVGRHLQGHVYGGASALFAEDVVDLLGPGPAIATCDFRHGNPGVVGGGMLANEFVPTPATTRRWLTGAGLIPRHGPDGREGLHRLARRLVRVVGPAQEVTTAGSRVRLDPRVRDGDGNAVAALSGGLHPEDRRTQAFLSERAAQWLHAAGAERVVPVPAPGRAGGPSAGQHQAGTARSGTDAATSVTDPFGRVWGYRNLRVVDASVHVTNGGVNPVLTVMAGAARTTEHLLTGRTRRQRA